MKKKIVGILIVAVLVAGLATGCTDTIMTKNFGGNMTLNLEKGRKLEQVTWDDNGLWYLTRPMKSDERPETYTFNQDSIFGIFEGTVTIVESR